MYTVLDLFSGIGGFSLGLERTGGFKTIAFCEYDKAAQKVLKLRWPDVPIYPDIRELTGDEITADVITGGYPCQPFSVAGKRGGATDDRHLWPEMYRIIKAVRPRWVIAENVAGHVSMGLDAVLSDMEAANYTCWPFVIPACAVDAKHRRDRVWIVANANGERRNNGSDNREGRYLLSDIDRNAEKGEQEREGWIGWSSQTCKNVADSEGQQTDGKGSRGFQSEPSQCGDDVPGSTSQRQQRSRESIQWCGNAQNEKGQANILEPIGEPRFWPTEPAVGRVANGIPRRVDRLKQLGNSVVPAVVTIIGRAIMKSEAIRARTRARGETKHENKNT
jgi:DNA (cytosine-5)-methyltransferase 1